MSNWSNRFGRSAWLLAICLALLATLGCGGGNTVAVSGNVTLDDSPLQDGSIVFIPKDKSVRSEGAQIKDGNYRLYLPPGNYRVEIRASKKVPGPTGTKPRKESIIPPRYNSKSELKASVKSGETNKFPFPLKSKPKAK